MKSKSILITITFSLIFLFTLIITSNRTSLAEPTWQIADGPIVELSIRDKFGEAGRYTATFIVNAPDGKQYKAIKNAVGSEFFHVIFPGDFNAPHMQNGKYTYKTMVGNKVIYTGSFQYHNRSVKMEPTDFP
jgi:hypothetical protein